MSLRRTLKMATPQLHRNGVYYARLAVPADLWIALGKKEVTKSLGTRDPKVAVSLFKIRVAELEEEWAGLRAAALSLAEQPSSDLPVRALTHKEAHALAGKLYRQTLATYEHTPGTPDAWLAKLRGLQGALPAHARMPGAYVGFADQRHMTPAVRSLWSQGPQARTLASEHGFALDAPGLMLLSQACALSMAQAYGVLMRNARGDYSPDQGAARFPDLDLTVRGERPGIEVEDLLALWREQPGGRSSTQKAWSDKFRMLMRFAEKTDVLQLTRFDVESWRDHRLKAGKASSTISNGDLAAVRKILEWAAASTFVPSITENVAEAVRLRSKTKKIKTGARSFSLEEANTILAATLLPAPELRSGRAARRWVPWLCAYSGARVGEIGQLTAGNVIKETAPDGTAIWCMRFTPEDGSIKTDEARIVPIHPHVIEQGFLDYVKTRTGMPLFYNPALARGSKQGHRQSNKVGEALARWVQGAWHRSGCAAEPRLASSL